MTVSMVNPARVKHVAKGLAVKSKTATLDAVIVARYGRLVKPPAWPPPPPESIELKALMTRLEAIETELRRERNRLAKAEITPLPTPVMDSLHNSVRFLNAQQARLEQTLHGPHRPASSPPAGSPTAGEYPRSGT